MKNKIKKFLAFSVITGLLTLGVSFNAHATTKAHYYNQKVTAYVSEAGVRCASGLSPVDDYVAVHPQNYNTNGWNKPIFKFGSSIFTDTNLTIPNYNRSTNFFVVADTGELKNENGFTRQWFDIWCGTYPKGTNKKLSQNWKNAWNFGTKSVSYEVWY